MPGPSDPAPAAWGRCSFCGDAVPPDSPICPICGSGNPVRAGEENKAPRRVRRRLQLLAAARLGIMIIVIVALGYLVIQPVLTGPPVVADPLTQAGTYLVAPGNYSILAGEISGEDYVTGNFTVMAPLAGWVEVQVFNTSEFTSFRNGTNSGNQSYVDESMEDCTPSCGGLLDFAAPYTDTYYFVFINPYPVSSNLAEAVYVSTQYQTNVVTFS